MAPLTPLGLLTPLFPITRVGLAGALQLTFYLESPLVDILGGTLLYLFLSTGGGAVLFTEYICTLRFPAYHYFFHNSISASYPSSLPTVFLHPLPPPFSFHPHPPANLYKPYHT